MTNEQITVTIDPGVGIGFEDTTVTTDDGMIEYVIGVEVNGEELTVRNELTFEVDDVDIVSRPAAHIHPTKSRSVCQLTINDEESPIPAPESDDEDKQDEAELEHIGTDIIEAVVVQTGDPTKFDDGEHTYRAMSPTDLRSCRLGQQITVTGNVYEDPESNDRIVRVAQLDRN